jgi:hypothetical protein
MAKRGRPRSQTPKVKRMTKPSRSTEPKQEQLDPKPEVPKVEQAKTPDPPCASCGGTGFVDEGIYVPSLKPCSCTTET